MSLNFLVKITLDFYTQNKRLVVIFQDVFIIPEAVSKY